MLDIPVPDYKFCPFCGRPLEMRQDEHKERKFCPVDNWMYYPRVQTSSGAIIIKEGKVLMVQRKREPHKDTWVFPCGFSDYGEHPEETARREVLEETGLTVTRLELMEIIQADDFREPGHNILFYRVSVQDGALKTDEEENENIAWVDIHNPPPIGFLSHQRMMKKIQAENTASC